MGFGAASSITPHLTAILLQHRKLVDAIADAYSLPSDLIAAIVLVESSGNARAYRFEPEFWRRYLANNPLYRELEPTRVSASYGLMQVMLPVARELGLRGEPEVLFEPSVSVVYGCKKLRQLFETTGDLDAAVAAYNGGLKGNRRHPLRNATYLAKVMEARRAL